MQARFQPPQGPQQPVQAHLAADGIQRQRRGARRRPAADAAAACRPPAPHRLASRGHRHGPSTSKARDRAHILEGLKVALDNLDEVIATIRQAADVEHACAAPDEPVRASEVQANAILEMQLRWLAALERKKIEDEYVAIIQLIAELEDILANPRRVLEIIKAENLELERKYAGQRRTRIQDDASRELSDEDLIADEDVVVTISGRGYIKRQPLLTYRRQARGGKGIIGARTVEEDAVAHLLVANTHDWVLFFTNRGRVFSSKVHAVPDASRQAKGVPVINLEGVQGIRERVLAVITLPGLRRVTTW
ncbi:MAG: DNA gyrase C-terminal beta-propeller domain-containing protein [Chloroflexota bacterium]